MPVASVDGKVSLLLNSGIGEIPFGLHRAQQLRNALRVDMPFKIRLASDPPGGRPVGVGGPNHSAIRPNANKDAGLSGPQKSVSIKMLGDDRSIRCPVLDRHHETPRKLSAIYYYVSALRARCYHQRQHGDNKLDCARGAHVPLTPTTQRPGA